MSEKIEGVMSLQQLIDVVDQAIQDEIDRDGTGALQKMFDFFNSDPDNPLTHREFIEFWGSLDDVEKLSVMMRFL